MTRSNLPDDAVQDPNAPGGVIFARFRRTLDEAGFSLRESWSHGSMCDAVVESGGQPLCRVSFTVNETNWTLNVYPLDPRSIALIVKAGNPWHPDAGYDNEQLDHVEALFRSLLVREGSVPHREFPTDYALRKWVALASTVSLPYERTPRRPVAEGIVLRPLEAPLDRHPSRSDASKGIVRAARLLDRDFDRAVALDLAETAARHVVEAGAGGKEADPAMGWLARSARNLIRGRRRDMDLAWNKGSYDAVLVGLAGPRDDMNVPYEPEEIAVPAPGP